MEAGSARRPICGGRPAAATRRRACALAIAAPQLGGASHCGDPGPAGLRADCFGGAPPSEEAAALCAISPPAPARKWARGLGAPGGPGSQPAVPRGLCLWPRPCPRGISRPAQHGAICGDKAAQIELVAAALSALPGKPGPAAATDHARAA
ncbi:uncharacterized protein LOC124616390 [Schistocerca americana]|uniref:uncharacterized protein LOC124616390 n=1 Tax=Schistocerca americana TaxID=7009 RepID=UPI001F4FBDED|nr:uncharacterized protein LOC124616390 [Schistocerca americana]